MKNVYLKLFKLIKKAYSYAIKILYPNMCIFCGEIFEINEKVFVCPSCKESLEHYTYPNEEEDINKAKAYSIFKYDGMVRSMLHRFKFHYHPEYSKGIVELITEKLPKNLSGFDYVVAIPMHPKKQRKRGFDQTYLIAKQLSEELNIPFAENKLIRIKNTKPQFKLKKHERIKNIKNAFKVTSTDFFKDKSIILIDDIYTTGITSRECKQLLLNNGADKVLILVFAKTF